MLILQHCCFIKMKIDLHHDKLGIVSSTLCMIHCIGTPFIFFAKACQTTCCSGAPVWWLVIDYIFLVISFVAIYYTTQKKINIWLNKLFWISWTTLLFAVIEHSFSLSLVPNYFIYIPAFIIILLHIYSLKYCKCSENSCCIN